mgnify:CR=1 FL=1
MSTFTENYDFIKPDNEDYYDIQDFNENMDAIDAQLAQAEQKAAALSIKSLARPPMGRAFLPCCKTAAR